MLCRWQMTLSEPKPFKSPNFKHLEMPFGDDVMDKDRSLNLALRLIITSPRVRLTNHPKPKGGGTVSLMRPLLPTQD